ncbi:MAG: LIC12162 family protein [Candidatus Margulisiibacteriota bacterium]
MRKKSFLATTALEEFWDTSMHMVFLGPWCKKYSRKHVWEKTDHETLVSPLSDQKNMCEAYNLTSAVYKHILKETACALNSIHGEDHGNRYWEIIIGPWIFHYIDVMYDRYISIKTFLDTDIPFSAATVCETSIITPLTTDEFVALSLKDEFNHQIYSRIIDILYPNDFTKKPCKGSASPGHKSLAKTGFKDRVKEVLNFFLSIDVKGGRQKLATKSAYFPYLAMKKIIASAKHNMLELKDIPLDGIEADRDAAVRKQLVIKANSSGEFTDLLRQLIPLDIPMSYIENYKAFKNAAERLPKSGAVFSSNSWYFDELFKIWAADRMEQGAILIGAQHGGNYGSDLFMRHEDFELGIVDKFYSWGWDREEYSDKIIPFYANTLTGNKEYGSDNSQKGVLLISAATPRYLYRINVINNHHVEDYIAWQMRFAASLSKARTKELKIRLFPADFGCDHKMRLNDSFPEVALEDKTIPFLASVICARIVVCDHLSTPLTDVLSANKPTIIFWDPKVQLIRSEAQPFYDALHSAGILYYSPEDAAKAVETIYDDVEKWWNEPGRKKAVALFCNQFARTSKDSVKAWAEEFKKIISEIK